MRGRADEDANETAREIWAEDGFSEGYMVSEAWKIFPCRLLCPYEDDSVAVTAGEG